MAISCKSAKELFPKLTRLRVCFGINCMATALFTICTYCASTSCYAQGSINLPASIASSSAVVEPVKTGLGYSEGPAVDASGNFFFTENAGTQFRLWKVTPQGTATVARTAAYINGTEFDPQGRLVCCQQDAITRMNFTSGVLDTIAKSGSGFQLLSTNDLSIATSGAMFFTNHNSGKTLFYRSPTGVLKQWSPFATPNGVEYIEEKGFLYLCLSDSNRVDTYAVGSDGSISNRKTFVTIGIPDGITLDEQYNVYIVSNQEGKIYVYDSTGRTLGSITMLQGGAAATANAANCVFGNQIGGPNATTLYIAGNGGVYKVALNVPGRIRGGKNTPIACPYRIEKPSAAWTYEKYPNPGAFRFSSPVFLYDLRGRLACRYAVCRLQGSPASGMYIEKESLPH